MRPPAKTGLEADVVEPTILVATDDRHDWYYIVEAPPAFMDVALSVPGIKVERNRVLVHRCIVDSDLRYKVIAVNPAGWAGPRSLPKQDEFQKLYTQTMREYQREYVDFSFVRPGTLNADDLGTGKTIQALASAYASQEKPVLVVGTLLTKGVWCGPKSEPMKWLNIDVRPLETRKDAGPEIFKEQNTGWWFCHYDILEAWMPWICNFLRPRVVMFDEAHNAAPKTKRGRAASSISRFKEIRKRIVLSATPVRNKRIDFWNVLDLAAPDAFGDRHAFGLYYCGGVHGDHGWKYEGTTHNDDLTRRLKHVMMRRTKREVMAYMPPITRQPLEIEMSEVSVAEYSQYRAAEHDIRKFLAALGTPLAHGVQGDRLVQLTKMLGILSRAKYKATVGVALETLQSTSKVVIFCWFKEVAKAIAKDLQAAGVKVFGPVTGDDAIQKRLDKAQAFADETVECAFVATLAAASESINQLACAQDLIINDLYWKPSVLLQTEGRLHRGGQKGSVRVVYVLAKNTIDDDLLQTLFRKADASAEVGIEDDGKALVRGVGRATSGPIDDLDAFVSAVQKQIDAGGYGFGETELLDLDED